MTVRLSEEEGWEVVRSSHTAIVTTLRRDGWPISLPVWFCVIDRTIYVRTPSTTKKVARVRHDERACFLVESGLVWRELRAVMLRVRAAIVEQPEMVRTVHSALEEKYGAFRVQRKAMPDWTRQHYASGSTIIALHPIGDALSWDNKRIELVGEDSS